MERIRVKVETGTYDTQLEIEVRADESLATRLKAVIADEVAKALGDQTLPKITFTGGKDEQTT